LTDITQQTTPFTLTNCSFHELRPVTEPEIPKAVLTTIRFQKWSSRKSVVKFLRTIVTWRGGKIYVHFRIDPLNNAGLSNQEIIVFMPFNAKTIKRPVGRNGKSTATKSSNYRKLMRRLFGIEEYTGAIPSALKDKLFIVNVRTI
jgi:hypothetical protein